MNKKFYITAAIPYVNAEPHIGHALEFVQTDVIKRYYAQLGYDAKALSGGDENALKNIQAAERAGVVVQNFVDENTEKFHELTKKLGCQFDFWQKGSDVNKHFPGVQEFWKRCEADIYKKKYEGLYCVGCEAFYTPDELNEKGECFEHPGKPLQKVSEENYFFRLSKYQNKLIDLIKSDKLKIVPKFRKNEVISFLKEPLQDISISRTNERAKNWGVPVPDDPSQRIYVWFDALNIYQTGIGFGWNENLYKKYWPADVHVIGKGITRFHAIYWPAFLISAKLKLPKTIFIHGYLTINGQKLSKTVGNVIDPLPLIEKYGADAIRYYLLAKVSPFGDGDLSEEKLKTAYNADLANGLGNLVARVAKLCETSGFKFPLSSPKPYPEVGILVETYKFDEALKFIWNKISLLDKKLNEEEPWKLKDKDLKVALRNYLLEIREVGFNLAPFLPETSRKILAVLNSTNIIAEQLFPRII
jgi:methionyl-tRNA synthetase